MLTSQLERARVSAVEEFKSSEAYDDVNTKYFLSGFNFLKKQAKEKFPSLILMLFNRSTMTSPRCLLTRET
jgi:hypothetical protein